MMHPKTISIAMCTYNGEKYIGEQLESIAKQTRLPFELIICDDRSSDTTAEIVRAFAKSVPFPVRFSINPINLGSAKKGITRNFEQACELCKGDYIALCDQDDIWFPEKLERLATILEGDSKVGGVFSDAQLVDDKSSPTGVLLTETSGFTRAEQIRLQAGDYLPILLSMTKVYGCTMVFDSHLLEKILPVPPNWWFDAWVSCMVAVHSGLAFHADPVFYYRIHSSQFFGAAVPTLSDRIQQWRSSAKKYWQEAGPQLRDLCDRLESQHSPQIVPHLEYIHGRMELLQFRSELPSNPFVRLTKIIPKIKNYHRYFNGWKSIAKDLTS